MHTKKIKETKTKPEIKRIKTEMKTSIYNLFQLKHTIENNQNLNRRNQE